MFYCVKNSASGLAPVSKVKNPEKALIPAPFAQDTHPQKKRSFACATVAKRRLRNGLAKSRDASEPEPRSGNAQRQPSSTDSINVYFSWIKRFPLLTAEEERVLAERIAKGDAKARQKMIESNLRLVVNIAKHYMNRGFSLQDLIEEGNIGLIKAVERFKPVKGCKFSTYATYWIKQSIDRGVGNKSNIVRLPIHVSVDIARLTKASKALMMTLNREPDISELAQKTGFSGRYVKKLDTLNKKNYSLDSLPAENTELPLLERLADDRVPAAIDLVNESRRIKSVNGWLGVLDGNEREVISLRFGIGDYKPRTLDQIGRTFGVTRERVRQIQEKALTKLRDLACRSSITSFDIA